MGLETHPNCSFDYVEIRDGLLETDQMLAKYCNSSLPAPIISSGPHLSIRFHSDNSGNDVGFHITFTEIPGSFFGSFEPVLCSRFVFKC